eukprot:COSAG05_NODE_1204_length_5534_cov_6.479117_1_plen_796_part_00
MEIEPPPWTSDTIDQASKRDIVVYLRTNMASVPKFLEKHRLKGQEKAVVKGSRMPALKEAYAEFREIFAAVSPDEAEAQLREQVDPQAQLRALLQATPERRLGLAGSLAGLKMAQGEEVQFGGGVVVVEFWATWCGPCKTSIPHLNELSLKYKNDGVKFIGITSEGADEVEPFIRKMGDQFTYPVGLDNGGKVTDNYPVKGIPAAFVVDKSGIVTWQGHPADKGMEVAIEAAMDAPAAQLGTESGAATADASAVESTPDTAKPSLCRPEDYAAVLDDPAALSHAAVARGKAQLAQLMGSEQNDLDAAALLAPLEMFMLAQRLEPDNIEAKSETEKLEGVLKVLAQSKRHQHNHSEPLDVVIVGAGASGVGVALMLTRVFGLDPKRVLLVERGAGVGETFRQWPREMRFISPSFNHQGWTASFDLNSVAHGTSPAFTLHAEHPTGEQYATYLGALADSAKLRVRANTEVTAVRPLSNGGGGGFELDIASKDLFHGFDGSKPQPLRTRYVIWAAGEFQYPRASGPAFPGSELCVHNSSVRSWTKLAGDDFVVIGGYESGMDATSNLTACGKRCTVVSSTAFWNVATQDPSMELSPYTAQRLRVACASSTPPRLLAPLRVSGVERDGGDYLVRARWGPAEVERRGKHREPLSENRAAVAAELGDCKEGSEVVLRTPQPPLLCIGFEGSVVAGVAKELFAWGGESGKDGGDGCLHGSPLLTMYDESTKTPGLFLTGPAVRHGELSFCFVYKFRQRFGIVADAIARGLGRDTTEAVQQCRKMNMYLDDFSCCKAACGESC